MRGSRCLAALGAGAALLVSGCSGPAPTTPTATPQAGFTAQRESTCVVDPEAVVSARLPKTATDPMPTDLASEIDAAATASFALAAAPGAIVFVQTPEGTFSKAYGMADPTTGAPMATDMYQRVGSVTKTFTVTVVLQLAEEGLLTLDDPIGTYIDGVPNGDLVTLRQLSDMTSGVASYTFDETWLQTFMNEPDRVWNPQELVDIGTSLPPLFEPGAEFDYSNTNTVLLGQVIEQVTGQDVASVFAERIFDPLGLSATSDPGSSAAFPEPHPRGYTLQSPTATPENPTDTTEWNPSWGWTAGQLISNGQDMLVYARALGTGQGLLDAETQIERLTSFPGAAGYGLGMGCSSGWVGHAGELPGFNSSVFYDTSSDSTVITMTNSDIASGDCAQSPTLLDNPTGEVCSSPATRMFVSISEALGNTFVPAPKQ
ncbi:serine hydrolase domain-containing protein [Microbacterium sp. LWH12-1.2]|uniref:serine hydrolase domain-containing protein n=1 Tax=Microbacterium sp. LWH12-1.2 TaxID=3135259 RepID=UPI00344513E8